MLLGGKYILSLFISGTPEEYEKTMAIAYYYLSIMSICLPILYLLHVLRSAIQGMGNTVLPMLSGVAEFIMRTLSALFLPLLVGQTGIFYAEILAWIGGRRDPGHQLFCEDQKLQRAGGAKRGVNAAGTQWIRR